MRKLLGFIVVSTLLSSFSSFAFDSSRSICNLPANSELIFREDVLVMANMGYEKLFENEVNKGQQRCSIIVNKVSPLDRVVRAGSSFKVTGTQCNKLSVNTYTDIYLDSKSFYLYCVSSKEAGEMSVDLFKENLRGTVDLNLSAAEDL